MSNNYSKRVIALGSAVALGSAAFVAVPAQAVDDLTLVLASGTSFNSVTGYANELSLNTNIASAYADADVNLSYRIINSGEADVQVKAGYTAPGAYTVDGTDAKAYEYDEPGTVLSDSDSANLTFDETDVVVELLDSTNNVGDYSKSNIVSVGVKDATATNYTVTVQAWLDNNSNQKIDGTEVTSNIVTLNFYDETSITATSAVTAPVVGATSVSVVTTTTPALNGEQLGTNFINAKVTAQGNANAVFASNTRKDATLAAGATTYSALTGKWTSKAELAFALATQPWSGTAVTPSAVTLTSYTYVHSGTTVTITTAAAHGVAVGDIVTIAGVTAVTDGTNDTATNDETALNGTYIAATGTTGSTLKLTKALTGDTSGSVAFGAGTSTLIATPAAQATAVAGTYSADAYIGTTVKLAAAAASGVAVVTASDVKGAIVGSADYTGGLNSTGGATAISVRSAFKGDIPVTATIYTSTGATVAAGVSVQVTADSYTGTLIYVNGTKITAAGQVVNLTTDASGKVAFNVKSTNALATDALSITISAEGTTGNDDSQFALTWDTATYALYDLKDVAMTTANINTSRTIDAGGSYTFNLALVDQWGAYLTSNLYRYEVATTGNTATTTTHVLDADGVTEVTISDQGLVGGGSSITVDVDVEKLVSGAWTTSEALTATSSEFEEWTSGNSGRHTITVVTAQTEAVALNDSGNALGGSAADLDGAISTTALAAVDNRLSVADFTTAGSTNVSGVVRNATTLAAVAGAEVTVSGPSDYFFKVGGKIAQGSLTFIASSTGTFDVVVYSNKATTEQVVTVTSNGASDTVKVKFSGSAAANAGTSIVIDAPAYVLPASTLSFTATVLDDFGNGVDSDQNASNAAGGATVDAGDATYKITYTGPGLIVGTSPSAIKESAALGDQFNILLGANDSGTITITVSYDQNGDKDFTDVLDLVVTKTITIGAAPAADTDTKVNAGSFKGYVAVYAKGHEGKRLSAKIGNDWIIVPALASNFERVVDFTGAGVSIAVRIYIDRVLIDTINLVTK